MYRNAIVIATLALVPFLMFSDRTVHEGQRIAMAMLCLVVASSQLSSWPARLLGLYVALRLIADFVLILTGIGQLQFGLDGFGMMMWMLCAAVVCLAASMSTAPKDTFYTALCCVGLAQCVLVGLQLIGIDLFMSSYNLFTYIPCQSRLSEAAPVGSLGNPNFVAAYMAICAPFFLRGKWRWALIPLLAAILACRTSTAVLALVCGMAVFFYDRKHIRLYFLAVVAMLSGAALFLAMDWVSVFNSQRWYFWMIGTEFIIRNWTAFLFGNGLGAKTGLDFPLHNDWMQLWFHVGAVGVFLAAWWMVAMLRTRDRILKAAVLIAGINAIGNYPFHLAPSAVLIFSIFGLIERDRKSS